MMPNHHDWEQLDIQREENAKLRAQNKQLYAQFDDMVRQRDEALKLVYESGVVAGKLSKERDEEKKLNEELMDTNQELRARLDIERTATWEQLEAKIAERDQDIGREVERNITLNEQIKEHARQHADNIMTLDKIRREGGLVVHALDCAIALTEQLFIFLPEGTVLPSAVATCKHQLDAAMGAIHQRGNTTSFPSASAASPPLTTTGSTTSTSDSTSGEPTAGSLSPSPATTPTSPSSSASPRPLELSGSVPLQDRYEVAGEHNYKRALEIAGQNIITLSEHRTKLTATLSQAIILIDELITVMRHRGITPSGPVVVTKAKLDQQMRELLDLAAGRKRETTDEPTQS